MKGVQVPHQLLTGFFLVAWTLLTPSAFAQTSPAPELVPGLTATYPDLSGDGRWAVWVTGGPPRIFILDLETGDRSSIDLRTAFDDPAFDVPNVVLPSVSDDGSRIAFFSALPGTSRDNYNLHVVDAFGNELVRVVAFDYYGYEAPFRDYLFIDGSGRYVTFSGDVRTVRSVMPDGSRTTLTVSGDVENAFRLDVATGALARASADTTGNEPNNDSFAFGISDDGQDVLFTSRATDLPGANGNTQAYVRDMGVDGAGAVEQVSLDTAGTTLDEVTNCGTYCTNLAISADGDTVVFGGTDIAGSDGVFLWRRDDTGLAMTQFDNQGETALSGNGDWLSIEWDTVIRYDLLTGTGDPAPAGTSRRPRISHDGATLLFYNADLPDPPGETGDWWLLRYDAIPPGDAGTLGLEGDYAVDEDAGAVNVTVTRTGGSQGAVQVTLDTSDSSATAGEDYTSVTGATLSWADGDTAPKSVAIPIIDDAVPEGDEVFYVELHSATNGATVGRSFSQVTIRANDPAGQLAFNPSDYEIDENAGTVTVYVERTNGSVGAVSATVDTLDATATAGNDYTPIVGGTVSWADGDDVPKSIVVPIVDDTDNEDNEVFLVRLSGATGGALITGEEAVVTILANDNGGILFLEPDYYAVDEDAGAVNVTVTRRGGSEGAVQVTLDTVDGSATAGDDYTALAGATLNWADGDTAPKSVAIPILDDSIPEQGENFFVNLSNATNGAEISVGEAQAEVMILANDPAGRLAFSPREYEVDEDAGTVVLTVLRTDGSSGAVSATVNTVDELATAGDDYTPVVGGTVSWADGDDAPKSIVVPIIDDTDDEGDEVFFVRLSSATGGALITGEEAEVTILANDGQASPNLFTLDIDGDLYPGSDFSVFADGFKPHTTVLAYLESEPVLVGEELADEQGEVYFRITIPDDFPPGPHTVVLVGTGPDGIEVRLEGGIEVLSLFDDAHAVPGPTLGNGMLWLLILLVMSVGGSAINQRVR